MTHLKHQINRTFAVSLLFILTAFNLFSQKEKKTLRSGNDDYKSGKYDNAEKKYLQSTNEKQGYLKGEYNLGNAYYKQGKFADAVSQYESVVRSTNNKDTLRQTFHNLGNAYLKKKEYVFIIPIMGQAI